MEFSVRTVNNFYKGTKPKKSLQKIPDVDLEKDSQILKSLAENDPFSL